MTSSENMPISRAQSLRSAYSRSLRSLAARNPASASPGRAAAGAHAAIARTSSANRAFIPYPRVFTFIAPQYSMQLLETTCHCWSRSCQTSVQCPFASNGCSYIEPLRSEEHTSELQSLMRISYAVFCLKKKTNIKNTTNVTQQLLHIIY